MHTAVYIDVLFMINLILNLAMLYITKIICNNQSKIWRIFVGAIIGSLYAVLMFSPHLQILYTAIFKLMFSMVLAAITFKFSKPREFLRILLIFYAVNFLFAGGTFAVFLFTHAASKAGAIVSNGVLYFNISIGFLFCVAAAMSVLIIISHHILSLKAARINSQFDIVIGFNGKTAKINALIDTGNSLKSPVDGSPVIIAEYSSIKRILPDNIQNCISKSENIAAELLLGISDSTTNFFPVAYNSLGNPDGILAAFKADYIIVHEKRIENISVAIIFNELSKSQDFRALLHPQILTTV